MNSAGEVIHQTVNRIQTFRQVFNELNESANINIFLYSIAGIITILIVSTVFHFLLRKICYHRKIM